jgi:hypothetical protein
MKALCDEHASALRTRLTGNRIRAETWCKRRYYGRGSIQMSSPTPSARHGSGCSPSPTTQVIEERRPAHDGALLAIRAAPGYKISDVPGDGSYAMMPPSRPGTPHGIIMFAPGVTAS